MDMPSQQGFGTLPRQMDMPPQTQYSGASTLPRSFRTGSPMTGRSSSPVIREIPIQHVSSNQASQASTQPNVGHQTGPYGYTIYTGQQPGGGPGQQPSYPQQQPPAPMYPQASSNVASNAQSGYPQQGSAYAQSSAHAGYPSSAQGNYPETTWTQNTQVNPPQTTSQATYPQTNNTNSQSSIPLGYPQSSTQSNQGNSTPTPSAGTHETISRDPQLRQVPITHETSRQPQEQRATSTPPSQPQKNETPTSSNRESPESTTQSGNETSTPKKKPSTPMEQIDEVVQNIQEYEQRVSQFKGTKKDKEYKLLEEMLTRNLLRLDGVEAGCDDNVRQRRKQTVKEIQAYLDQLELKAFSREQNCDSDKTKNSETENNNDSSDQSKMGDNKNEPMKSSDIEKRSVRDIVNQVEHKC